MKVTSRHARWLGWLAAALLRGVGSTWRIRVCGHQIDLSRFDHLLTFRHGDMLVPAILYRRIPAAIMISRHGDGELIAQVVGRLGVHVPVRGSSSRGGARAFLEMVQSKGDMNWAITPDGPRGPRGSVGDGVIMLAAESGRSISMAGIAVDRAVRLRSWDRFVVPYPFSRIAVYLAEPMPVAADTDREQRSAIAKQVEQRLRQANEEAVRVLQSW